MKKRIITAVFAAVIGFMLMSSAFGEIGANGAPGETTCNTSGCHNNFALNSGGGSLTITDNIPGSGYVPGQIYSFSVTVARTGSSIFGFGFEAVRPGNSTAGNIINLSSQTYTQNSTRQNITHNYNAGLTSNSKTFVFNWAAPATAVGTVTFYSAGNAGNNNNSTSGDYIYTATRTVAPYPLVTGSISGSPLCEGATSLSVTYTATGTFVTGNVFTAELSDASGSFASPLGLGSVTSTANGTIVTSVPLPGVAGNNYRIRVVSSNPAVTGTESNTFVINPAPSVSNAGSNQTICGNSATLTANTPTTGTGSWSVLSGSAVFSSTTNPAAIVSNLAAGNNILRWNIASPGCPPSTSTVNIQSVTPPTTASVGASQTICSNFGTLTANQPLSGTGQWSLVSGAATISAPNSPTTGIANVGTGVNIFQWEIANAPCPSSTATVSMTYSGTISIANAGTDQTVCAGNATISANSPTAGTGAWSLLSGTATILSPTNPVTVVSGLTNGTHVFRWTISNGNCTPSSDDVSVTSVTVSPAVTSPGQTLCTTNATLSATAPAFGAGTWSVQSGGAVLSGSASSNATVTGLSPGANVFVWTVDNPPCASSSATVTVVQSGTITSAFAGTDQSVCGATGTLSANIPLAGTGAWSVISGTGLFSNPSSPSSAVTSIGAGQNIYRWTISNGTCVPSADDIVVTGVTHVAANAGVDQQICNNSATLTANNPAPGAGVWALISGTGSIQSPSTAVTSVTGLGTGLNIFRWTIMNPPCPLSFDDVNVDNCNALSIAAVSVNTGPYCQSTSYVIVVPFIPTGSFSGYYTAELSDALGSFNAPIALGSGPASPINGVIPAATPAGTGYRVRVRNSQPAFTGTDNGANISINTCNPDYITLDRIKGSPFCANTSYTANISFSVNGNAPAPYIVELSDIAGSFAAPLTIGYGNASPIFVTIPSGVAIGSNYRIRVRSYSAPVSSGPNNSALSVNTCGILALGEAENAAIRVYPTIADGVLHIDAPGTVTRVTFTDVLGRNVLTAGDVEKKQVEIDVSGLLPDVYFVHIVTDSSSRVFTIVKN